VLATRAEYPANRPVEIAADVVDANQPREVTLLMRQTTNAAFKVFPMRTTGGYTWRATIPAGTLTEGPADYYLTASIGDAPRRFPSENVEEFWKTSIVKPTAQLPLFNPDPDSRQLASTRIGDAGRRGMFRLMPAAGDDPAALRLFFPLSSDRTLDDYTASLSIKDKIVNRRPDISTAKALRVKARGISDGQALFLTLVEADGTSWCSKLVLKSGWEDIVAPIGQFQIGRGVKLPLGFPERWNYWLTPAKGRGGPDDRVRVDQVERLQFSFRPAAGAPKTDSDPWADIISVTMVFE
jgi:hypothetical protein